MNSQSTKEEQRYEIHSTMIDGFYSPSAESTMQELPTILDRRAANILKVVARECDRVTEAADQFSEAMEERVDAVVCSMEQMNTELCAVNAAVVSLQAK